MRPTIYWSCAPSGRYVVAAATEGVQEFFIRSFLDEAEARTFAIGLATVLGVDYRGPRGEENKVKVAPLGYCPVCGAPGARREKRPDGNDVCERGHEYPSREAKQ